MPEHGGKIVRKTSTLRWSDPHYPPNNSVRRNLSLPNPQFSKRLVHRSGNGNAKLAAVAPVQLTGWACLGRRSCRTTYGAVGRREVCWSTICHLPPILDQVTLDRVWYVVT